MPRILFVSSGNIPARSRENVGQVAWDGMEVMSFGILVANALPPVLVLWGSMCLAVDPTKAIKDVVGSNVIVERDQPDWQRPRNLVQTKDGISFGAAVIAAPTATSFSRPIRLLVSIL